MNFYIYAPCYTEHYGGNMVLYKLANDILTIGHNVSIYDYTGRRCHNIFCTNYRDGKANDTDIVIYPEGVEGNPLGGTRVIRWILCELGKHSKSSVYTSWSPKDLVYHYSTYNANKSADSIRPLFTLWMNPAFVNTRQTRHGSCFTIRKGCIFHNTIQYIHPQGSTQIPYEVTHTMLINEFNRHKYFYCYDPYSFLIIIAALCGCIPIVIPIDGVSKSTWLQSLYLAPYLNSINSTNANGIAYGIEDIEFAQNTIHMVKEQTDASVEYGYNTVKNFLKDMENYDECTWTVENVYLHKE